MKNQCSFRSFGCGFPFGFGTLDSARNARRFWGCTALFLAMVGGGFGESVVMAAEEPSPEEPSPEESLPKEPSPGHGPSSDGFLSHDFQWEPHRYQSQFNLHFGLSQPLLFEGFNVAADFRIGRWVFEYSHGMFLNYNAVDGVVESFVNDSSVRLDSPWTTGGGVGFILLDDLYVMAELKAHHYNTSVGQDSAQYTTISVGPALAYRLFVWRGLNLTTYFRWWPTVWDSTDGKVELGDKTFDPVDLGFFANLSLGWSFDL